MCAGEIFIENGPRKKKRLQTCSENIEMTLRANRMAYVKAQEQIYTYFKKYGQTNLTESKRLSM